MYEPYFRIMIYEFFESLLNKEFYLNMNILNFLINNQTILDHIIFSSDKKMSNSEYMYF